MLLALIAAIQTLPGPTELGERFATNPGDPAFLMWQLSIQSNHLFHDPAALLQGNIFWPHHDVLAYSDNLVGFLPVFAPVFALTPNPVLAYNITAFASFWLSDIAVFALARRVLRRPSAAVVGAVLFACLPYHSAMVAHVQLSGFLFVPLALLAIRNMTERARVHSAIALGCCLAGAWYTSLYAFEMVVLGGAAYAAALLLTQHRRQWTAWLRCVAISVAVAAVAIAPSFGPYLELARTGVITRSATGLITASPAGFLTLPPSLPYSLLGLAKGSFADVRGFFPGVTLVVLVVGGAGMWLHRLRQRPATANQSESGDVMRSTMGSVLQRRPTALALLLVAVCGLGVMPGPNHGLLLSGYDRVLRAVVPGMASLRDLTRFWLLPGTMLALAGGCGFFQLTGRTTHRIRWFSVFVTVIIVCIETLYRPSFSSVRLNGAAVAANHLLAALPAGPVLELPLPDPASLQYDLTVPGRQLRSEIDMMPRVGGYSGAYPDDVLRVIQWARRVPASPSIAVLQHDGVRYLLLHGGPTACSGEYSQRELGLMERAMQGNPLVAGIQAAGNDVVVTLRPDPDASPGVVSWPMTGGVRPALPLCASA